MDRPDNITTFPKAFGPFVYVDFAFGGLSALFLALHWWGWASVVLWIGVPPNLYFAIPGLLLPGVHRPADESPLRCVRPSGFAMPGC